MAERYFKPHGLLTGADAERAIAQGQARLLAGGGLAFGGLCELSRESSFEAKSLDAFEGDAEASAAIERLSAARPSICGLDLARRSVMGILNVTPDSFSDGGEIDGVGSAVARASAMALQGADVWDVGGESTRPGSALVPPEEEADRVLPVVAALADHGALPISIDSRKPEIFRRAVEGGASMINDVSALTFDETSLSTAAELDCPVLLMHAQGDPKTMQDAPAYENVLLDVFDYLEGRIQACVDAGIDRGQILIDPGIGFGKTLEHNLTLLRNLSLFHSLGCGIVLGTSRKSFIAKLGGSEPADKRLGGSIATVVLAAAQGVQVFRVHDVLETRQALSVWESLSFV